MKHIHRAFVRRVLVLACLSAGAAVHAQSGADLATGSATLSNLTFSLVDLAPQSGQGTWIQFGQKNLEGGVDPVFGSAGVSGLIYRDADGYPVSTADQSAIYEGPLPQQTYNLAAADGSGTVSVGPGGMSATMRLGANAFDQAIVVPGADRKSVEVWSGASFGQGLFYPAVDQDFDAGTLTIKPGYSQTQPVSFTLSAHTQLVMEADASAMVGLGSDLPYLPWDNPDSAFNPMVGAGVQIALARTTPVFPFADVYTSWGALADDLLATYEWQQDNVFAQQTDDPATSTPVSRRLRVTLTNNSDEALDGLAMLTVAASAQATQAVPEPATYLLMGLGLVGIFWRRRVSGH
ncbi:MAG TPA: PEP-CTERM sorting domain-containing protein [Aquabacterium sp.]|uniref:PEP-CTERM sorting domain-containing protein n=1 Tax=Aquabacterium sp. TaxID=1872578 RepID=UPI002E31805F|nr:PEP-CTERM sorting domain-containing protein [Aquabacterium sp.]HEX5355129.1 PEP-CTERM sorting domain-containing protein [Aquabacterium sp.]